MDYGQAQTQSLTLKERHLTPSATSNPPAMGYHMYPPRPEQQLTTGHYSGQNVAPHMKGVEANNNSSRCLLCSYPYPETKLLPCVHHFHMKCLQRIILNSMCPVCRHPIAKFEQVYDFPNGVKTLLPGGYMPIQSPIIPTALQPASEASLKARPNTNLRRGKWTQEEEAYANRLIQEFRTGYLPLSDGTTLRTFLSKLLNCDPMRISKKFVGSQCIGKQVFRRKTISSEKQTPDYIEKNRQELVELERRFLSRINQQKLMKEKKMGNKEHAAPPIASPIQQQNPVSAQIQPHLQNSSSHSDHLSHPLSSIGIASKKRDSESSFINQEQDKDDSGEQSPVLPHKEVGVSSSDYTVKVNFQNQSSVESQKSMDNLTDQQSSQENLNESQTCFTGQSAGGSGTGGAGGHSYIPRIPSMENLAMFGFPRVDSLDGLSNLAFSRVPSFDNMLNLGMPISRNASVESLSSLCLPRVASMDSLYSAAAAAAAASCTSSSMTQSSNKSNFSSSTYSSSGCGQSSGTKTQPDSSVMFRIRGSNGIPAGGLPRVPSLDKLSRPSSFLNLNSSAESSPLPRVSSVEKLSICGGGGGGVGSGGGSLSRVHSSGSFGIPRVSSIEDILSLVASSEIPSVDSRGGVMVRPNGDTRKRDLDRSQEYPSKHLKREYNRE